MTEPRARTAWETREWFPLHNIQRQVLHSGLHIHILRLDTSARVTARLTPMTACPHTSLPHAHARLHAHTLAFAQGKTDHYHNGVYGPERSSAITLLMGSTASEWARLMAR